MLQHCAFHIVLLLDVYCSHCICLWKEAIIILPPLSFRENKIYQSSVHSLKVLYPMTILVALSLSPFRF